MLEIGIRVVRGPDWKWATQDDGEGHVGTLVEIGKPGSGTSPDKTVVVQWDSGNRTNYRVGYQGAFDLRMIDNAQAGICHQNIICNECRNKGILGMLWKCKICFDYDLCLQCYMSDKHDLSHSFKRFDTPGSIGVEVGPREGSAKVKMKGIFMGARVARGPDWDWNDQDGGEGSPGIVIDIRGWDGETGRSVANVAWCNGTSNVYRLGHKGKVDLKYLHQSAGGFYYRDHIPILGLVLNSTTTSRSNDTRPYIVGDKVRVSMDVNELKRIQEGHGGWNPRMADYIGKIGTVHRMTDRGDIRVQYENCNNRWTFHPAALTKVESLAVGDHVRVKKDPTEVRDRQKGHGEWIEAMRPSLGKVGRVMKVYKDGDLRVNIDGKTWTLNPLCVENASSIPHSQNTSCPASGIPNCTPLASLVTDPATAGTSERLVREAAQGHLDYVRETLNAHPEQLDARSAGKTCLMVASHQGHMDLVSLLLDLGADLSLLDDDGDTALHYAAFGNQGEIMECLLNRGAHIDTVNASGCSALHVAVNKQHRRCVEVLLERGCNINLQDSYGDTALHDAIGKESLVIIKLLSMEPTLDITLRNKRGFNALHHAALKGNTFATERLITRAANLVDHKKDDGFSALHLACLNGHRTVADTLLSTGHANLELRNNRQQTPLHLAVSQGHCALVELLVSSGADLRAFDEDGDTALHLAFLKRSSMSVDPIIEIEAPTIHGIYIQLKSTCAGKVDCLVALAIVCYLVQEGAQLSVRNKKGKTPLENLPESLFQIINSIVQQYESREIDSADDASPRRRAPPPAECVVCSELGGGDSLVRFDPCGHRMACEECASRIRKCLECGQVVQRRITGDGRMVPGKTRQPSAERLRYLETKIAEIEEAHCCSICMERRRNVVFLCGHGACDKCSQTLRVCHMCRKTITKKINIY